MPGQVEQFNYTPIQRRRFVDSSRSSTQQVVDRRRRRCRGAEGNARQRRRRRAFDVRHITRHTSAFTSAKRRQEAFGILAFSLN